jgi:AraC-like DNA-binding protein
MAAAFARPSTPLPHVYELGGGGPERARIVCCLLGCDERPYNPLIAALPSVIHLSATDPRTTTGWLRTLLDIAAIESGSTRTGSENVLARLSELMLVETIRRYVETLSPGQTGWLAGLRDPIVGQALAALHGEASKPWTVARLARLVGLSRSVLAKRFAATVGHPPMQYLASWRMQLASRLLVEGGQVAAVADAVGYGSEAAFSRAFKKLVGQPPATWRRVHAPSIFAPDPFALVLTPETGGQANRTQAHGAGPRHAVGWGHAGAMMRRRIRKEKAMTSVVSRDPAVTPERSSHRANALADRLEQGARALANLASALTDAEWQTPLPEDGRKVGVIVHHVASLLPLEIQLAQRLAGGEPVTGVTWDVVHEMNARHAKEYDAVTKEAALDLLGRNSTAAATAIRALSDEELNRAAPVSLYSEAPLTCQFMLEDHAVRHSYHHLDRIRRVLKPQAGALPGREA